MNHPVAKLGDLELVEQLSASERRALQRAERTIASGMRAFVEVGMALKAIRDGRLYRQEYGTFEEYCARRWELSRRRGYELCSAAEVVEDLSANAHIRLLPENEGQTRPLTRLKNPAQWRRAWQAALKLAAAEDRPVTARDTEEAVRRIDGNGRIDFDWADTAQSVYDSQDKILSAIQRLHCPFGYELDVTFGNGGFWQKLPRPKLCFDLNPADSSVRVGDFRHLPIAASSVQNMLIDPPFLTYTRPNKKGILNGKFSGYWKYEELMDDYSAAISEAFRILKRKGVLVFKCQDTVHNHTLQFTHGRVWLLAEKQGFRLKDLFVLVAANRLPTRAASHGRQTQRHARVFHCYFLVFEKP